MKLPRSKTFAWLTLGILSLCEVYALYCAAFSLWMTAYPFADVRVARTHLYEWIGACVVIGLCWIGALIWLLRQRHGRA